MSDRLKVIKTNNDYVKVHPYSANYNKHNDRDMEEIEREINRHIDNIGSTEIICEEKCVYNDEEYGEIEGDTLYDICRELAYQEDLIKDNTWTIEYNDLQNEHHKHSIYNFESILWYIVNNGAIITHGELTDEQKYIVQMANKIRENRYKE